MIDKIFEMYVEMYKKEWSKEIGINENLNDILNSKSKDNLLRIITLYKTSTSNKAIDILDFKRKSKKDLIECIVNNIKDIVKNTLIKSSSDIYNQLVELSKNDGYDKVILSEDSMYKYSVRFATYLYDSYFGKVYYNKSNNNVELFLPKEVTTLVLNLSKDKQIVKDNKKYNKFLEFLQGLLESYGVFELMELVDLLNNYNINYTYDELLNNLLSEIQKGEFNLIKYKNSYIISNISFDEEDDAIKFYESVKDLDINDKLSYNDIVKMGKYTYIDNLEEYKDLKNFLLNNYDINEIDIEEIKFDIVDDYMFSRKLDKKQAISNFRINVEKIFDIDPIIENIIINKLEKIYEKLPKWEKRGNI
ncbi:MAG: hypothetical protein J6O56_02440 [Bacilli bacterium]|nr:hypothetical protein [Bacilli bacterium]